MFGFFKNSGRNQVTEESAVYDELYEIERKIAAVRSLFSAVDNSDLIEAYVYELDSLEAKRSFLLKRAKELNMSRYPFQPKSWNETA